MIQIRPERAILGVAAVFFAGRGYAQQPTAIAVRNVAVTATTDSSVLQGLSAVRQLSNGSVLAIDPRGRRLILLDSTLKKVVVGGDANGVPFRVPGGQPALIPYVGDSTIVADPAAQALVVIGPSGRSERVFAPHKASDLRYFSGTQFGIGGFDRAGRLIFRGGPPPDADFVPPATIRDTVAIVRDSAPLIRADLDARRADTIAMIRVAPQKFLWVRTPEGRMKEVLVSNPLPTVDAWAFFDDGTVAIVRGQDYHIDWIAPDGARRSTPKMPFDWRPMSEEAKRMRVDSAQHVVDSIAALTAPPRPTPGVAPSNAIPLTEWKIVSSSELPDYHPPIGERVPARVDAEQRLWLLPTTSIAAGHGLLYDVINREGVIIERVQLPLGRVLVGLGPGGTLYLSYAGAKEFRLERARILR